MKNWKMKALYGVTAVAGAVGMTVASASNASAAILDFSGMSTAITAELTPAVTSALPIAGTLLAVAIGYKLFRRFVK